MVEGSIETGDQTIKPSKEGSGYDFLRRRRVLVPAVVTVALAASWLADNATDGGEQGVSIRRSSDVEAKGVDGSSLKNEMEQVVVEPNLPEGAFGEVFGKISDESEKTARGVVNQYKEIFDREEDLEQMSLFLNGWGEHLENESLEKGLDPEVVKGVIFIES